jgi:hypothetical protein
MFLIISDITPLITPFFLNRKACPAKFIRPGKIPAFLCGRTGGDKR